MPKKKSPPATKSPKKQDTEKLDYICTAHDKIKDIGDELSCIDIKAMQMGEIDELQEQLNNWGMELVELADWALERGQAMEDRLYKYLNAIEDLGFTRNRR